MNTSSTTLKLDESPSWEFYEACMRGEFDRAKDLMHNYDPKRHFSVIAMLGYLEVIKFWLEDTSVPIPEDVWAVGCTVEQLMDLI